MSSPSFQHTGAFTVCKTCTTLLHYGTFSSARRRHDDDSHKSVEHRAQREKCKTTFQPEGGGKQEQGVGRRAGT